jgi:ATP-binding cassette subfamily F protein uup
MPLFRLDNVTVQFGPRVLLDGVNLNLYRGDRIGLLGRNGEGKTTLLKVIAGDQAIDGGERWLRPGVRMAWLDQALPEADEQSVYDYVAGGLQEVGELLKQYHHAIMSADEDSLRQLEQIQQQLEDRDGWRLQQRVETVISQLQLPAEKLMRELSGGWRRRVALARALVRDPDILLLDEPTNHLDIPAIEWLEKQLREFRGAILFVTHDRDFLQNVANTIVELDRGDLYPWKGDYQSFLVYRAEQLAAQETANKLFDKKLAQEEVWIRQGIKARRTRNEGRVRALESMREQHQQRRVQQGKADFSLDQAGRSGKIVAELKHVSHNFGGVPIIQDFSSTVMRGDRIGLVGANGAGKSTLLKILLGELKPQSGEVKIGTNLKIAYFDQLRQQLNGEQNLIDNVCGGREFIEIDGKQRHAISYLGDFLFSPERARTPVKALSGGEQNRAILAKLFSKPANLLVLDEPTNDLDVETLELLEEVLLNFAGTVLLVSHDRVFLDNVVTSIMVLEGDGVVREYVGGYHDWIAKGGVLEARQEQVEAAAASSSGNTQAEPQKPAEPVAKKLSYKDQRELDQLPQLIEKAEAQQAELEAQIAAPGFYQGDHEQTRQVVEKLGSVQAELEKLYQRWSELDG